MELKWTSQDFLKKGGMRRQGWNGVGVVKIETEESLSATTQLLYKLDANMDIVVMYSGDDVKKLGGTGGVYKLNKYLALRQLCERQIAGIQEGHWGLTPEFAKSDPFISTVKLSQGLFITREEIADFLNVVEILDAPEDSETLDCELSEALGGQSKSEESSQKCESDLKD